MQAKGGRKRVTGQLLMRNPASGIPACGDMSVPSPRCSQPVWNVQDGVPGLLLDDGQARRRRQRQAG
eukprot:366438-Chlamydomonas_euryale.AAC.14